MFLDKLIILPEKSTYNKVLYRNIPQGLPNPDPTLIIRSSTSDIDNRFKTCLYLSKSKTGNFYEVDHYNGGVDGRDLYMFDNVHIEGLLDLTKEENLVLLGTTSEKMKLINSENDYMFTQVIGGWAKKKGYNGIIFEGARGNGNVYENLIIFDDNIVSKSLNSYKIIKW